MEDIKQKRGEIKQLEKELKKSLETFRATKLRHGAVIQKLETARKELADLIEEL